MVDKILSSTVVYVHARRYKYFGFLGQSTKISNTKSHCDLKHYNVCIQINDKETFYSVFVYYSVVVVEGRVLTW